jgi:hypothetical protein
MSISSSSFALSIKLCAGSSPLPSGDIEGGYQWEV